MGSVATELVAWLAIYTYQVAALTVLIGALGVPLPSTVVVLAAGSITGDGDPDLWTLFGVVLVSAVVGDLTSYSLGRWASRLVLANWGEQLGATPARLAAVERRLERWGGLLVIVTRCLLTGLAIPTNLVAGATAYPLSRFLVYAALGEAIWVGELLALGWYFGPGWVELLDYLNDTATVLTTLAVAVVLVLVLTRLLRPRRGPGAADDGDDLVDKLIDEFVDDDDEAQAITVEAPDTTVGALDQPTSDTDR